MTLKTGVMMLIIHRNKLLFKYTTKSKSLICFYTNLLLKSSLFIKVFFLFLFLLLIMVSGQLYHAGILNLMQKSAQC